MSEFGPDIRDISSYVSRRMRTAEVYYTLAAGFRLVGGEMADKMIENSANCESKDYMLGFLFLLYIHLQSPP